MKKIVESKFELMKVSEIKEFFHNINDAIVACSYLSTNLAPQVALWKTAYDRLNWAYGTPLKADESNEIHDLDFQTDNWITALKAGANGASKSYDEEMRVAGETLKQTFVSFPVKLNDNYIAELGQVDSLLAVLKQEAQLACVTKIGMLPLFNLLVAANDRMHELIADRDAENKNRPNRPQARREAISAYLAFTDYVNSYRTVIPGATEDEGFNNFVALVDSIIDRFERVILNNRPTTPDDNNTDNTTPDGATGDNGDNTGNQQPGDNGNQQPGTGSEGSENNPSNPGTPSNPSNPNNPTDPDDDPDALKPGPGGDDPDL